MERKSCFGTLLLDASHVYCRACEVFDACQEALRNADASPESDASATDTFPSASEPETPDERSTLQSSIEAAFSGRPLTREAPGKALDPPLYHVSDGARPKKMVHFSTRLPEGLDVDLKVYCALNKMTVQAFIAEAIQDRLDK